MKYKPNHLRLLAYLRSHKSITSVQIFKKFGIRNGPDAIFKIRSIRIDADYSYPWPYWDKLKTNMVSGINRYGKKVRYASYSLEK